MKQVYSTGVVYKLNNMAECHNRSVWHYGEVPEDNTTVLTFEEASKHCGFVTYTNRKGEKKIGIHWEGPFIKEKNFQSASVKYSYTIIPLFSCTVTQLIDKLTAQDFVEWCKDNDLSVNVNK